MKCTVWSERILNRRLAGRLFWALLVLIHIPALVGAMRSLLAGPDLVHLLSVAALVVTVGCFILKLLGLQFLPRGSTPGRAIVFVLIAALVHHEAAATAARQITESPAIPVAVATTLLAAEGVRRIQRHLPGLRSRLAALIASHCSVQYVRGFASSLDFPAQHWALVFRPSIPRAPPA